MLNHRQVTWIMPVLNGMPYLPQALESIAGQSLQAAELLVWDNGSTDGSLEELRRWIPGRIPGRVFSGRPLSLGNSLAALALESKTSLLARMDADDICLPQRLERQLQHLREHPHLALVGSERQFIDANSNPIANRSALPLDPIDIRHATLRAPRLLHPSVLMSRAALLECGNYQDLSHEQHPYWSEDYDLWLRLQCKYLVATMPECLILYRDNPAGVSEQAMRTNRAAQARRLAWMANCAEFAGLTHRPTAELLWQRQLWFSFPTLRRIARHLSHLDGVTESQRFSMPSFLRICASFLRQGDWLTRLWIKSATRRADPSRDPRPSSAD